MKCLIGTRLVFAIVSVALFCTGCGKQSPSREAEKAFTKMFEKDYPDWEISKIILSPCKGANMYRGRFDCTAKTSTYKCCAKKAESIGVYSYGSTHSSVGQNCDRYHYKGSVISWSVIVTYAHGDCYYKLGATALEYE